MFLLSDAVGARLFRHGHLPTAGGAEHLYTRAKRLAKTLEAASRRYDRYRFEDRRVGHGTLVLMLVGYKPELWDAVFVRFRRALPEADVCLVSPGRDVEALAALCRRHGWSYLSTATNDVCLAQNIAIGLHAQADLVVKLDEDMFLLPKTLSTLLEEYESIRREGIVDPGYVAPMIPLNGVTYRFVLQRLQLLDAYEARFGKARLATAGIRVQNDPEAARWIWEHTAPLETSAARITSGPVERVFCPVQFSIGCIVFARSFWSEIGGFVVFRRRLLMGISTLGADEAWLCARAQELSRPGVVTSKAVAGHFAFGPQYDAMRQVYDERRDLFA